MVEYVLARRAEGVRRFQLKLGADPLEDAARTALVVEQTGDEDLVVADANGGWRLQDAVVAARALEDLPRVFLEQPCATLEECAQIRRGSRRPLILDESLFEIADIVRGRAAGAVDALRLKLTRFGGITPVRRARDLAVIFGLPLTIEDSGGGDVVTAAVAHLAASIPPKLLLAGYLPSEMSSERIARGTPAAVGGRARLPDGSGLGIEVDDALLGDPVLTVE
jgi:cis-L-3-hydroxyproline dehydratase